MTADVVVVVVVAIIAAAVAIVVDVFVALVALVGAIVIFIAKRSKGDTPLSSRAHERTQPYIC